MSKGKISRITRHFKEQLRYFDDVSRCQVLRELALEVAPRSRRDKLTTSERICFKRWLWWKYGPECAYCHRYYDWRYALTIDHIQPVSKGGALRDIRNMVLACRGCNATKGNMWEE